MLILGCKGLNRRPWCLIFHFPIIEFQSTSIYVRYSAYCKDQRYWNHSACK